MMVIFLRLVVSEMSKILGKFRAKIKNFDNFKEELEELTEYMMTIPFAEDGYVEGFYLDGYVCGEIEDVTDEYISPLWWIKVDKETLEEVR